VVRKIRSGGPRGRGTRITVSDVLQYLAGGMYPKAPDLVVVTKTDFYRMNKAWGLRQKLFDVDMANTLRRRESDLRSFENDPNGALLILASR
jgi:hypothetical protein